MVLCEEAARGNLSGFSPAAASDINLIDIALCLLTTSPRYILIGTSAFTQICSMLLCVNHGIE